MSNNGAFCESSAPAPSPSLQSPALAVAVSGGPDSMALLDALSKKFRPIIALTVNHHLRPEAASEAALVGRYCAGAGIAHHILPVDVGHGGNLQARARIKRYDALIAWCLRHRVFSLATAHHRDDLLETYLLRLRHGSGETGLASIAGHTSYRSIDILRPCLDMRKQDLLAYCRRHAIPFVTDPGNRSSLFERVRIRNELSGWPQADTQAAMQTLMEYRHRRRDLELALCAAWDGILREAPPAALHFDWPRLCAINQPLWYLARAIAHIRPQIKPLHSQALGRLFERLAAVGPGATTSATLGGCQIIRKRAGLWITAEAEITPPLLPVTQPLTLWDRRFMLNSALAPDREMFISPLALAPSKKIQQLSPALAHQAKDVPAAWRQGLPCLKNSDGGIISIYTPCILDKTGASYGPGMTFLPCNDLKEIFSLRPNLMPEGF